VVYQPISCQSYDYIEIACMHHYSLRLVLNSGEIIEGIAQTTHIHDNIEFLQLELHQPSVDGAQNTEIRLDTIKTLQCLRKP
jgi:Rho-binding antiterminator